MAVVRTMVDGNGLLEHWPSLAPGKPCTSEVAKQELIAQLTQYHDSTGVPVTLIFVGHNTGPFHSTPEVEIVFTPTPKAAESLLLRFISRIKIYGEVIVVTDNLAEHTRLESAGATIFSCAGFIQRMESALSELEQDITRYNQKERIKFTSGRIS